MYIIEAMPICLRLDWQLADARFFPRLSRRPGNRIAAKMADDGNNDKQFDQREGTTNCGRSVGLVHDFVVFLKTEYRPAARTSRFPEQMSEGRRVMLGGMEGGGHPQRFSIGREGSEQRASILSAASRPMCRDCCARRCTASVCRKFIGG